jgi:hypothetical protein
MKPETKPQPEIAEPELSEAELDQLFAENTEDPFGYLAPRLGWLFKKYGQEELRQCLFPEGVPEKLRQRLMAFGLQPDYYREDLLDAASELSLMGLRKVAAVATEVALLKGSRFDQPPPAWAARGTWWRAHQESEREKWQAKRKGLNGVKVFTD